MGVILLAADIIWQKTTAKLLDNFVTTILFTYNIHTTNTSPLKKLEKNPVLEKVQDVTENKHTAPTR